VTATEIAPRGETAAVIKVVVVVVVVVDRAIELIAEGAQMCLGQVRMSQLALLTMAIGRWQNVWDFNFSVEVDLGYSVALVLGSTFIVLDSNNERRATSSVPAAGSHNRCNFYR